MGMDYSPSLGKYLIATFIFFFASLNIISFYNDKKPSSLIILLINLVYFIPGCTFYSFSTVDNYYFLFFVLYWILLNFWSSFIPFISFGLPIIKQRNLIFSLILFLVVCGSILVTGIFNGFKLTFNLFDVYELRESVTEMNLPGFIGYFKPVASSLVPIGIVLFLIQRKYIIASILVIVQLFLFAFGGHKTALFILIISVLSVIFIKGNIKIKVVPILIILNIIGIIETWFNNGLSLVVAFLQRRNMFTTNLLSSWYYEFFSNNSPDYLQQSFLRNFGFESNYEMPIPFLISLMFTGRVGGANNGMVGDAFANFGWFSLLLYPLLIILALRFYDYCVHGINNNILFAVGIIFTINFVNSSFFTILLTHGFVFITIALYFLPREAHMDKILFKRKHNIKLN